MGSNPILPTPPPALALVADTAPLQGLHRGGALELLREAGAVLCIPGAVEEETRGSFRRAGGERVPDLDAHPWIRVERVSDEELAAFGAAPLGPRRHTFQYTWRGHKLDRPELEAVFLARRAGATLLIEDGGGLRCARLSGVTVTGVAAVLRDLARAGRLELAEAGRRAKAILDTRYHSRELEWLSRGIDEF